MQRVLSGASKRTHIQFADLGGRGEGGRTVTSDNFMWSGRDRSANCYHPERSSVGRVDSCVVRIAASSIEQKQEVRGCHRYPPSLFAALSPPLSRHSLPGRCPGAGRQNRQRRAVRQRGTGVHFRFRVLHSVSLGRRPASRLSIVHSTG